MFDMVKHYIMLGIISIFVLFPFYWMFLTSVKPPEDVLLTPPVWWPTRILFDNYVRVWTSIPLTKYLINSILYAALSTLLCILLASFAAYSLSRLHFRFKKMSLTIIIFTQLIPSTLILVPFYFMIYWAGLNNTIFAVVFAYTVWALPFCILMLRSYFTSIPVSLEESATIDGCGRFGILFRIVLPISLPGIMATAIFSFILAWNEFMWTSIVLTNSALKPLSVGLYDFVGKLGLSPVISLHMTAAVISAVPSLILFIFLQKYLISGLAAGAVKG